MAGLRSNYELKKWQAVQNVAQVPLAKVISGLYTEKDMNTLGQALEAYDDLASSIFNEGLRAVEEAAKNRVERVQEHRTLVKKPPLSAKQLAIIYGQAVDKAQKETMPQLIDAIKELLTIKAMTPQPESEGLHLVGAPSTEKPEPSPKKYNLSRFTPGDPANDAEQPEVKTRKEEDTDDGDSPTKGFLKGMSLVDDLEDDFEDLEEGQRSISDDLKQVLDLVKSGYEADTKERTKLEDLIERISTGSMEYDSTSKQLKLSYISDAGYYHEVTGKNATDLKTTLAELNKQDRKRQAAEKKAKAKTDEENEAKSKKGMFSGTLTGLERAKRLKELKALRRERDIKSGKVKEGAFARAGRLVDNSKEEYGKITDLLKERYSKTLVGKAASKIGGIGKLLLGLFLLPKMLSSLWGGFTKQFDVQKFLKEALSSTLKSVWEAVKALLGIDRQHEDEYAKDKGALGKRGKQLASIDDMSIPKEQREAGLKLQKDQILAELKDPKGPKYTDHDAALIKQKLGIDIPEDRKLGDTKGDSSTPTPMVGSGAAATSAPAQGGSSTSTPAPSSSGSGSSAGSPTTAETPAGSPSSSSTPSPKGSSGGSAPVATSVQVSSAAPKASGGLTANSPIALSTPASGKSSAGAAKPVVATPPPKAVDTTDYSNPDRNATKAGSSPINSSSVPNTSANHETGLYLNRKSTDH